MKRLLVVVDMQRDFIDGSLGTKEAQAIVPAVRDKVVTYQAEGWDVAFTLDTHEEHYLDTQEGKKLPIRHCIAETDGWELCEELGISKAGILKRIPLEVWNWPSGRQKKDMKKSNWLVCVRTSA